MPMTTLKRGDIREADGLRFWRINRGREIWVTQEVFGIRSAQDAARSLHRWTTKRIEVQHTARAYYIANREHLLQVSEDYRKANPEKSREWKRKHARENREDRNRTSREKYAGDEFFRARVLCRNRIYRCLMIGERSGPAVRQMLGCSPTELRNHMESQFRDGMTWGNHGTVWEVDHIIPLISAKTPDEVFQLSGYANLQPLLCAENRAKSFD